MSAALGNYLKQLLDRRGWTAADLATAADVPRSTLSHILNDPDRTPDLATFVKLARALDLPLRSLLEVAGYSIEPASSPAETARRIALYVEAAPELEPVFSAVLDLPLDDQIAVLAFVDALRSRRRVPR